MSHFIILANIARGVSKQRPQRAISGAVAPPDELDARLYEVLERLGHGGSAAIVEALGADAPPLRTVQRRLQKLVSDGVLTKRGARKNAVYVLADRDVPFFSRRQPTARVDKQKPPRSDPRGLRRFSPELRAFRALRVQGRCSRAGSQSAERAR